MVAVEMGDQNRINERWLKAESLHGDECGGTAVEQDVPAIGVELDAGLESPAGAESIAAAQEPGLHLAPYSSHASPCMIDNGKDVMRLQG